MNMFLYNRLIRLSRWPWFVACARTAYLVTVLCFIASCALAAETEVPFGKELVNGTLKVHLTPSSTCPTPAFLSAPFGGFAPTICGLFASIATANPATDSYAILATIRTADGYAQTYPLALKIDKSSPGAFTTGFVVTGYTLDKRVVKVIDFTVIELLPDSIKSFAQDVQ